MPPQGNHCSQFIAKKLQLTENHASSTAKTFTPARLVWLLQIRSRSSHESTSVTKL